MKKLKTLSVLCFLIAGLQSFGQEESESKREILESMKQEYIMESLELTEKQSADFEGLLKKHEEEKTALRKELEEKHKVFTEKKKNMKADEELSEADAKMFLEHKLSMQEKKIALERKYMDQYVAAIGAKKVIEYRKAEEEFKKELLHMLKDDQREHHMRMRMKQMREERMSRKHQMHDHRMMREKQMRERKEIMKEQMKERKEQSKEQKED